MPAAPLISFVIPVFGVAAYLPQCLDSVLRPAGDIEVIAVDDASPDGSGALLDDRAAADSRLRVVHLAVNGGPGRARDAGLALASGEYVWFVDADDRVAHGALAAVRASLRGRPDVLLIDWAASFPATGGGPDRTVPSPGHDILSRVPAAGCTLADQPALIDLTMTSWSKLLRREFLAQLGVSFGPGIHEDVLVTCAALLAAKSVGAVCQVCYRYRQDRAGQFMGTASLGHLAIFTAYRQVFDLIDAQCAAGRQVSGAVRAAIFERAIWHYTTVFQAKRSWPGAGGLIPRRERRAFFGRMHADFTARRPPGYRLPPGARGLKFALIARNAYLAYVLLEPLNRLRVAWIPGTAARHGRAAGPR
ncbi:MAG: glycosyltransferase family 2 protein [Streptosporangiaceae bacterium]